MSTEEFLYLAAVIAAHPNRQVVGRTRLQKTVKLLQRLGLPTDYRFMNHFYGPYSEGVHSDIGLLEQFGFIKEKEEIKQRDGSPYYIMEAEQTANADILDDKYRTAINKMSNEDPVVLELAATYDSFREMGADHKEALERLRRKKGSKCDGGNDKKALDLLERLGLPTGKGCGSA